MITRIKNNIDRILFYFVCLAMLSMLGMAIWNRHEIIATNDYLTARRLIRDQEFADIRSQLNSLIDVKVDHRYRDLDAAADFAKRDNAIKELEKRILALETK